MQPLHPQLHQVLCIALGWGCVLAAYEVPIAAAESPGLGLNWVRLEGAENCISAGELMTRIEKGRRLLFVRSDVALVSIEGYVRPSANPKRWSIMVALSLADGSLLRYRRLVIPGDTCSVIDEPLDLAVNLLLDPDGDLGNGVPLPADVQRLLQGILLTDEVEVDFTRVPQPQLRKPAESEAEASRAGESQPARSASEPTDRALFDVGGTGVLGELPGLGLGLILHATLITRIGWQLELGFASLPGRVATAAPGHATFELQMGSLALCPWQILAVLALCGGAEYGRMTAAPSGFASNEPTSGRSVFDVLGFGVLRLGIVGPLFMRGAVSLVLPLLRNDYSYATTEGERRLFRMSAIAGRVELGIGLRL